MEAFYVMTDQTGFNIEFACMLCNMFPKTSARSHFNQTSGEMAHVELELAFTCTMYTSPDINAVAQLLLNKYRVLYNYLDFNLILVVKLMVLNTLMLMPSQILKLKTGLLYKIK